MRGGGDGGASADEYSCAHGARINFYLTYECMLAVEPICVTVARERDSSSEAEFMNVEFL